MKKIGISVILALGIIGTVLFFTLSRENKSLSADVYYLNAYDMPSYTKLQKLAKALQDNGKKVVLSGKENFKSGLFNLYATSDYSKLPEVMDKSAINFLWLQDVPNDNPEILRPFDVIVVQTMPSFSHLKAINVRTAFIPPAIDIINTQYPIKSRYPMYYGNHTEDFSLSLFLAGPLDMTVYVFGNFAGQWPSDELKEGTPQTTDFQEYPFTLVDQTDEDVAKEVVNKQILEIIAQGGLPFIRYNPAVAKLFGETVPMYMNEQEFKEKFQSLLNNPREIMERREALRLIAKQWDSNSQAQKFIELFEIMQKKMR